MRLYIRKPFEPVHALARRKDFAASSSWIKKQLRDDSISSDIIDTVLSSLIHSKSIIQDSDGNWHASAFVYNSPQPDILTGFKVYQVGLSAVIPATEKPEKYKPLSFNMLTLSFKKDTIEDVKKVINDCRNNLIDISQKATDPDMVTVVNLNFVTIAEKKG